MKARHFIILAIFLLIIGAGLFKLMGNKEKFEMDAEEKSETPIRYVKTMQAVLGDNEIVIEGQGKISSSQKVDMAAEVQGLLIQANKTIKPGVTFRKGEVLYTIKFTDARLALLARRSNYLNLIAGVLPDLKLDFANNYENWKLFYESIDVNQDLPLLPDVKTQKEKTFISLKNIYTEYFNIKADEERLRKYVITAPFDGSITEVFVEPGSIVNPGTRIASIIRTGDLEIDIPVNIHNIHYIKIGSEVNLKSITSNSTFTGKVVRIGEFVNATTQSIPVYIKVEKKKNDILFNGMYLVAEINCGVISNSVKIPRRALPDKNHYYTLSPKNKKVKVIDWVFFTTYKNIKGYTVNKVKLKTAFVLKNDIVAININEKKVIVVEPLTQFTKETLFRPLKEIKQ